MDSAEPKQKLPGGPEQLLLEEDYFSLMLCGGKVSLGSFSEVQGVFDQELLRQVYLDRSAEIPVSWGDARLRHLADKLSLVDGTLLATLPRMHWVLWINEQKPRPKLHLKFSVLRQAACHALITTGIPANARPCAHSSKRSRPSSATATTSWNTGFSASCANSARLS